MKKDALGKKPRPNTQKPGRRREPARRTGAAIVDAIVTAAERVLTETGSEEFTMSHLAEVAGVSVGSVYQYFENKQAIVSELARRLDERTLEIFRRRLETFGSRPMSELLAALVGTQFEEGYGDVKMRRVLLDAVPRRWIRGTSAPINEQAQATLGQLFRGRADELRSGDPEVMAFIAQHAVQGAIGAAVMLRPDLLENEAFREDLVRLVWSYLRPEEPSRPTGGDPPPA